MPRFHLHVTVVLCFCSALAQADDVWIFSGQSNMQAIGGAAQRAVGEVVSKRSESYQSIYVAAPGKPIEAWLDADHKDHRLWADLVEKIQNAKTEGNTFRGFVWYQGESNTRANAGHYQEQLEELVARVRKLTGEKDLPVIVVQIGAATSYSGRDWAAATIREAQRRFVLEDPHAALVTAIDAEVGDYTVHLSKAGAEVVAGRIAAAADALGYDAENRHWGPQFKQAYFANKQQTHVVVEFGHVQDGLQLGPGWLAGFGASLQTSLPEKLSDLPDAEALGQLTDDYIFPAGGVHLDTTRLVLAFDKPLPEVARLSYAACRNAQYGPHRNWGLEFSGLTDASGQHAPAFVLVPIGKADSLSVSVPPADVKLHADWKQVAVNCVGRFPPAVMQPDQKAGIDDDNWRQAYWNPASAGLVPNLFDHDGKVTGVNFHTGVWYMSPYYRELTGGDDALMASWCKNSLHGLSGLKPGAKYDLAIYLLQGPPKKLADDEKPPSHREVRVSLLHIPAGKKRKYGQIVLEQTIRVPAEGTFESYELATTGNKQTGNVVVLTGVLADPHGRIEIAIESATIKGDSLRWGETTLAGLQIRPTAR